MNHFLAKIKRNGYFLVFIFLFAYAQSLQIRFLTTGKVDIYMFTPEAATGSFVNACLLFLIIRFFIGRWQRSEVFKLGEALKIYTFSLILYFLVVNFAGLLISLAFGTLERNYNSGTFINASFSKLMDAFIYGSFYLAYHHHKKNKAQQEQLAVYNRAISESRINQLKNQINPHFLFNNLNVLDQLIEEDKNTASDFLNEFADIYRYVLQVSEKKTATLEEELAFAKKYFGLIRHKYGNAYLLEVNAAHTNGSIVPLSLQLLLENVIKHNLGTEKDPVRIRIRISHCLTVTNNIIQKRKKSSPSERALKNLNEQYDLLIGRRIEIQHSENEFTVSIPLINSPLAI